MTEHPEFRAVCLNGCYCTIDLTDPIAHTCAADDNYFNDTYNESGN